MTEPSVCCVMLTANRPDLGRQAVENFRGQTYANKRLLILDTSETATDLGCVASTSRAEDITVYGNGTDTYQVHLPWSKSLKPTIGQMRNAASAWSKDVLGLEVDILVTFDDDDYSHPNRIAEQVALLQSSGADCVGYNEMLFAREMVKRELKLETAFDDVPQYGAADKFMQAWLYRNPDPHYALGTSLCYWRKTWERKPFEATSQGEDLRFIAGLKVSAVSAIPVLSGDWWKVLAEHGYADAPRMIARIHPGNTSTAYKPEAMQREAQKRNGMWKRVAEWDGYCSGVFA